ncbi:hypothetical protein MASR1M60_28340 [Rhodocyclaceae bacterium]
MNLPERDIDRESLYLEVWTDPVTVVAQRYGLSDVGLAKICQKLTIPLPTRGYWAKVKAGRVMKKMPLPKLKPEQATTVSLKKLAPEVAQAKQEAKEKAVVARKTVGDLVVPEELTDPHPLVKAASKRLKQRDDWSDYKGLRSAPDEILNLQVTKDAIDRALKLVDTLIKKLEKLGVTVSVDAQAKTTWLDIQGIQVSFILTEHVARSRHEATPAETKAREKYWNQTKWGNPHNLPFPSIPQYDYTPSGILTISAGRWPGRNWRDTGRTSLDDRLGEVVNGLFSLAEEIRSKQEEDRRREEARRLAEERYQFRKERLEKEQARFKHLEQEAHNYERASRLRVYADAVEQNALASPDGLTEVTRNWLAWARAKADWLDPLIKVSDPILDAPEPKRPGYW